MGDGKKAPWTKGRWHWWTSNSWRRLRSDLGGGRTVDVACPFNNQYDRHPDISVSDEDMALIAAAPALAEAALPFAAFIDVWLTMGGAAMPKSETIYALNTASSTVTLTVEDFLAIRAALSLARGEKR